MEIPCSALIRRVGPRWVLPGLAVAWGVLVLVRTLSNPEALKDTSYILWC